MTSRVYFSYSELIRYIVTPLPESTKLLGIWKYRKTSNIIEKTAVYHTVNSDPALFHTSKTAK